MPCVGIRLSRTSPVAASDDPDHRHASARRAGGSAAARAPAPITIPTVTGTNAKPGLERLCSRGSPARRSRRSRTSRRARRSTNSIATFALVSDADPEDAEPDQRRLRARARSRRTRPAAPRRRAKRPSVRPERPAVLLRLHDVVDEHEQAGGDRRRAGDVDRLGPLLGPRVRGCSAARARTATIPIGRLTKKTQRHEKSSVSTPPSISPTAPPPAAIALQMPSAFVRSRPSAKVVVTIESAAGETSAAPRPCTRATGDQHPGRGRRSRSRARRA